MIPWTILKKRQLGTHVYLLGNTYHMNSVAVDSNRVNSPVLEPNQKADVEWSRDIKDRHIKNDKIRIQCCKPKKNHWLEQY